MTCNCVKYPLTAPRCQAPTWRGPHDGIYNYIFAINLLTPKFHNKIHKSYTLINFRRTHNSQYFINTYIIIDLRFYLR